jgi:hypothetical protein
MYPFKNKITAAKLRKFGSNYFAITNDTVPHIGSNGAEKFNAIRPHCLANFKGDFIQLISLLGVYVITSLGSNSKYETC